MLFFVVSVGGIVALMLAKAAPAMLIAWAFGWLVAYSAVVVAKGERFW